MQITKITFKQAKYPDLLREIASPPKQLYVLGQLPKGPAITIVGSRRPTDYGQQITYQLAGELARAGLTIVSGLAYGLDAVAHRAALEAGGQTVAIMAGGLDNIYPAGHRDLAKQILAQSGGLISEHAVGTTTFRGNFVARNRIVAGLSLAVIVTEAAVDGGSMITANYALNQNRLVMAVPGNVTSLTSAGPNNLIKSGAIPITSASDVLAALDLTTNATPAAQPKSREEALILELLGAGHTTSEALIRASELEASQFANVITLMEITGKVRSLGAGNWVAR